MKTILLADDEEDVRETLGHFIERRGMGALKAKDGIEALQLYQEYTPDCTLLDAKLPEMDGVKVFQKIKQLNPQAKVYFITGITDVKFKDKVKELGADGYLAKPIVLEDLLKIVESI